MPVQLIADSGATKCEWCLIKNGSYKTIFTSGISPYFVSQQQIIGLLQNDVLPNTGDEVVEEVHFYGTGLGNPNNVTIMTDALRTVFTDATIEANTDLL